MKGTYCFLFQINIIGSDFLYQGNKFQIGFWKSKSVNIR